jgi:hypothetical protein
MKLMETTMSRKKVKRTVPYRRARSLLSGYKNSAQIATKYKITSQFIAKCQNQTDICSLSKRSLAPVATSDRLFESIFGCHSTFKLSLRDFLIFFSTWHEIDLCKTMVYNIVKQKRISRA